jgi:hypothetical protein
MWRMVGGCLVALSILAGGTCVWAVETAAPPQPPAVAEEAVATVVVAPADAPDVLKAKADLVCDGKDDQVELLASLERGKVFKSQAAGAPNAKPVHSWRGRFTVTWLPGNYELSALLNFPELADFALYAEGTYLNFKPAEGDVIHLNQSIRCRFNFGTIDSRSTGACITVTGVTMSIISFTGLVGHDQKGTGLRLFGTSTCKYEGTDISGFDVGVLVDDVAPKLDTNWFWLSYVRNCKTCIWEKGRNVDCNVWDVNVDATLPGATAIRIGGAMGYWHVIMGTYKFEGVNKAIILEPNATENVVFIHPPIENFAWQDNSGNKTNVILSGRRYRELINLLPPK